MNSSTAPTPVAPARTPSEVVQLQRARPSASLPTWVPAGRTLHCLDVENLIEGRFGEPELLDAVRARYASSVGVSEFDHLVTACNPCFVTRAKERWFPSRWLVRHGRDGADRALLEDLDPLDLSRRFARVVIGSGDGAFAGLAAALADLEVEVWVAARPGHASRRLLRAAHVVALLHLDQPRLLPEAA